MSTFQKIGVRIENLKAHLGKTIAELEKGRPEDYPGKDDRLLGNATISGWLEKDLTWTSDKLDKFLRYWKVNPEWWKTGEGEVILTHGDKPSDNKQNGGFRDSVYKTIVEGYTEYMLVPRSMLNETQLISTEQIKRTWEELAQKNNELAEKNKELENKNKQIDFYQGQFARLMENLELTPKPPDSKEIKNKG